MDLGPGSVARTEARALRWRYRTRSIRSCPTARTQTAFLDSEVLARNMETSDFSFEELCGGNISIYLVLPPDKLETYARWLRLMVSIAIRAVARGRRIEVANGRPQGAAGSRAFRARRVRDDREAERGRAGLRPHGGARHDHVGLRAGPQSAEARLPRPLGDVHRQFAGDDVLRRHGQFHGGVYQQDAGHLDDRADERLDLRRQVGCAHLSEFAVVQISENVDPNFDQLLDAGDEPAALASRRDPGPERRIFASSWDAFRRFSAGGSCITRIGISCTARGPIRTFPVPSMCAGGRCRERLCEMGSVARLLKEYGYEVKALRGGR